MSKSDRSDSPPSCNITERGSPTESVSNNDCSHHATAPSTPTAADDDDNRLTLPPVFSFHLDMAKKLNGCQLDESLERTKLLRSEEIQRFKYATEVAHKLHTKPTLATIFKLATGCPDTPSDPLPPCRHDPVGDGDATEPTFTPRQ